jgi:hypothetical protein
VRFISCNIKLPSNTAECCDGFGFSREIGVQQPNLKFAATYFSGRAFSGGHKSTTGLTGFHSILISVGTE